MLQNLMCHQNVKGMSYLHVLTDNNPVSCLNEVKDQQTGTRQHHREEMCTAANNGTYNILKNTTETCVTIHLTQLNVRRQ